VRTLVVLFGLPVAQILIFGFVIRNEMEDVKIAILDKSKDPVTIDITNRLLASGFFRLDRYLESESQIEPVFRSGKVREVIVFENDFAKLLGRDNKASIQLLADASDPNSAKIIVSYSQAIVTDYMRELNQNLPVPMSINVPVRMMYNADLKSAYMFVPGTMALVLMLVSAMMTSISITREKETGTLEALLVSPLRPVRIIAGKVTPYIILSFINATVILLMGYFIFQLPVRGSIVLLFAETILFITLALSLGIMISTISNSQVVAMFVAAFALLLPTLLLSGFIFPVENMPAVLQWLCAIMPPKYFITIIKSIMIKGTGIAELWPETLVLAGMLSFFLLISAKRFKVRLQ
jgi:ABC-2 type transport system permease protein